MIHQQKVQILSNRQIHGNYYQLGIRCDQGFEKTIPGQFVMIRLSDNYYPLLRRPFSIHNVFQDEKGVYCVELLYKVIGKGTRALSEYQANQWIDILGPIGNGFRINESIKSALMVSGGIGVAPMLYLAKCLLKNGTGCHLINGGRTASDVLCTDRFQSMGIAVSVYTDDGSSGTPGFVTDHLSDYLKNRDDDIIYTCGPTPMLSKVSEIAEEMKILCEVSLESHMACGMGACLGCAVASKDPQHPSYFHVCADGPVFSSELGFGVGPMDEHDCLNSDASD
jgi:dihydroorotate dehydrogenase electron transfer subunit